jgi:hypothetical protein
MAPGGSSRTLGEVQNDFVVSPIVVLGRRDVIAAACPRTSTARKAADSSMVAREGQVAVLGDRLTKIAGDHGSIRRGGIETTYWFERGRTTAYGQQTPIRTLEAGTAERAVAGDLTGLDPGSTVHVRLVARNTVATETSADFTFTTGGTP